LVTVVANAAALAAAAALFDGIRVGGPRTSTGEDIVTLLLVGVALGVINAVVAPLVKLLSIPLILLTLGLFLLLINAAMLWLAVELAELLRLVFIVDGFWTYLWGALIVALVSTLVSAVLDD
jgi:putative membrane protein